MKYEWLHYWKTWELKMKSIFGTNENQDNETFSMDEDQYHWESGDSIKRFDDPSFKENVKKL
jgi:hypothetical protein